MHSDSIKYIILKIYRLEPYEYRFNNSAVLDDKESFGNVSFTKLVN